MSIVAEVSEVLQGLMSEVMDELARASGCVKRQRKFAGSTLLTTLVLTVLRNPKAKNVDYQTTAAQLDVHVTEEAVERRFTPNLVKFLESALQQVAGQLLATQAPPIELLDRFTAVVIGDSTTITLPDELADQFPGCGGTHGSGKAAMKIQVTWDLRHGTLNILLEPGRAGDSNSAIMSLPLPSGSLSIFDLGYFSIDRFERVGCEQSYWISRLQPRTNVFDEQGNPVKLLDFLRKNAREGIVDSPAYIGKSHLPCRLLALRVPQEVAAQRRQRIRDKARDRGKEPSKEYLDAQDWTIFITNCEASRVTWKEVVILYRSRWQIELLFKLWKSHNRLAYRDPGASTERQVAELYVKLLAVLIQHGMLLLSVWLEGRRSLRRAASVIPDWIGQLLGAIADAALLSQVLDRMRKSLLRSARVGRRRKHPSWFQLLTNPELLEYTVA